MICDACEMEFETFDQLHTHQEKFCLITKEQDTIKLFERPTFRTDKDDFFRNEDTNSNDIDNILSELAVMKKNRKNKSDRMNRYSNRFEKRPKSIGGISAISRNHKSSRVARKLNSIRERAEDEGDREVLEQLRLLESKLDSPKTSKRNRQLDNSKKQSFLNTSDSDSDILEVNVSEPKPLRTKKKEIVPYRGGRERGYYHPHLHHPSGAPPGYYDSYYPPPGHPPYPPYSPGGYPSPYNTPHSTSVQQVPKERDETMKVLTTLVSTLMQQREDQQKNFQTQMMETMKLMREQGNQERVQREKEKEKENESVQAQQLYKMIQDQINQTELLLKEHELTNDKLKKTKTRRKVKRRRRDYSSDDENDDGENISDENYSDDENSDDNDHLSPSSRRKRKKSKNFSKEKSIKEMLKEQRIKQQMELQQMEFEKEKLVRQKEIEKLMNKEDLEKKALEDELRKEREKAEEERVKKGKIEAQKQIVEDAKQSGISQNIPYLSQCQFVVIFDFVSGINSNRTQAKLMYACFLGNNAKTPFRQSSLIESEEFGRIVFAHPVGFPNLQPIASMKLVLEIQTPPASSGSVSSSHGTKKAMSLGWTVIEVFNKFNELCHGYWKVPLYKPHVQPMSTPLNIEFSSERHFGRELYLRIIRPQEFNRIRQEPINPDMSQDKYFKPEGYNPTQPFEQKKFNNLNDVNHEIRNAPVPKDPVNRLNYSRGENSGVYGNLQQQQSRKTGIAERLNSRNKPHRNISIKSGRKTSSRKKSEKNEKDEELEPKTSSGRKRTGRLRTGRKTAGRRTGRKTRSGRNINNKKSQPGSNVKRMDVGIRLDQAYGMDFHDFLAPDDLKIQIRVTVQYKNGRMGEDSDGNHLIWISRTAKKQEKPSSSSENSNNTEPMSPSTASNSYSFLERYVFENVEMTRDSYFIFEILDSKDDTCALYWGKRRLIKRGELWEATGRIVLVKGSDINLEKKKYPGELSRLVYTVYSKEREPEPDIDIVPLNLTDAKKNEKPVSSRSNRRRRSGTGIKSRKKKPEDIVGLEAEEEEDNDKDKIVSPKPRTGDEEVGDGFVDIFAEEEKEESKPESELENAVGEKIVKKPEIIEEDGEIGEKPVKEEVEGENEVEEEVEDEKKWIYLTDEDDPIINKKNSQQVPPHPSVFFKSLKNRRIIRRTFELGKNSFFVEVDFAKHFPDNVSATKVVLSIHDGASFKKLNIGRNQFAIQQVKSSCFDPIYKQSFEFSQIKDRTAVLLFTIETVQLPSMSLPESIRPATLGYAVLNLFYRIKEFTEPERLLGKQEIEFYIPEKEAFLGTTKKSKKNSGANLGPVLEEEYKKRGDQNEGQLYFRDGNFQLPVYSADVNFNVFRTQLNPPKRGVPQKEKVVFGEEYFKTIPKIPNSCLMVRLRRNPRDDVTNEELVRTIYREDQWEGLRLSLPSTTYETGDYENTQNIESTICEEKSAFRKAYNTRAEIVGNTVFKKAGGSQELFSKLVKKNIKPTGVKLPIDNRFFMKYLPQEGFEVIIDGIQNLPKMKNGLVKALVSFSSNNDCRFLANEYVDEDSPLYFTKIHCIESSQRCPRFLDTPHPFRNISFLFKTVENLDDEEENKENKENDKNNNKKKKKEAEEEEEEEEEASVDEHQNSTDNNNKKQKKSSDQFVQMCIEVILIEKETMFRKSKRVSHVGFGVFNVFLKQLIQIGANKRSPSRAPSRALSRASRAPSRAEAEAEAEAEDNFVYLNYGKWMVPIFTLNSGVLPTKEILEDINNGNSVSKIEESQKYKKLGFSVIRGCSVLLRLNPPKNLKWKLNSYQKNININNQKNQKNQKQIIISPQNYFTNLIERKDEQLYFEYVSRKPTIKQLKGSKNEHEFFEDYNNKLSEEIFSILPTCKKKNVKKGLFGRIRKNKKSGSKREGRKRV